MYLKIGKTRKQTISINIYFNKYKNIQKFIYIGW